MNREQQQYLKKIKEKIVLQNHLWLTQIYLEELHQYFDKFIASEMKQVKKEFGKKVIKEIAEQATNNEDIFKKMDLEREGMKKKLSKKDFENWDKNQIKKFIACVNINDLSYFCDFFYHSLLILSFSLFENSLNTMCRELQKKKRLKIKLNDIKGNGVYRARIYLEKICSLKLPSSALFNEIDFICKIRNYLAHNGGIVVDVAFIQKIKSHNHIKIVEEFGQKKIFFEKEFCDVVIKGCDKYLLELVNKNENTLFDWRAKVLSK